MGRSKHDTRVLGNSRPHQLAAKPAYRPRRPFWTVEGIGSEAWNRLDLGAAGLLMRFYGKFNGFNRGNLSVTYRELKHQVSSLVFTRWVWQLIGYGFLDFKRRGRLERNCSVYALGDRWRRLSEDRATLAHIGLTLEAIEKLKREPKRAGKLDEIRALRYKIEKM